MLVQKAQNLLLAAVIVIAVVTLSFWFIIGSNKMMVQAQGNLSPFSRANQDLAGRHLPAIGPAANGQHRDDLSLVYQDIYTNEVNFLAGVELQELQAEVVDDLQSAILRIGAGSTGLSAQSINAGFEYIPSSAFRHDGFSPASGYRFWPIVGYIRNRSSSQMCLAAPVYVPNGATFTQVFWFFVDDSAASDVTIFLQRKNLALPAGLAETVIAGTVDKDQPEIFVAFFDPFQPQPGTGTVDNDYSYSLIFCFDPNTGFEQRIFGFIVTYS